MEIPEEWMASEKGNTWLSDDDGNHVAWFRVNGRYMEVSVTPGNSPGFYIRVLPDEENNQGKIAEHINKNLSGWTVVRCNIEGVQVGPGGMVA
jgi:hypothetical protein